MSEALVCQLCDDEIKGDNAIGVSLDLITEKDSLVNSVHHEAYVCSDCKVRHLGFFLDKVPADTERICETPVYTNPDLDWIDDGKHKIPEPEKIRDLQLHGDRIDYVHNGIILERESDSIKRCAVSGVVTEVDACSDHDEPYLLFREEPIPISELIDKFPMQNPGDNTGDILAYQSSRLQAFPCGQQYSVNGNDPVQDFVAVPELSEDDTIYFLNLDILREHMAEVRSRRPELTNLENTTMTGALIAEKNSFAQGLDRLSNHVCSVCACQDCIQLPDCP